MFFDVYYVILVLPALLLALWAQAKVQSAYAKYSRQRLGVGVTGRDVARRILDSSGLRHVRVEQIPGQMTDHYDPGAQVVRLSEGVYGSNSVASVGIAAHECGHALQHAGNYGPLVVRNAIIPVTNFSSKLAIPIFIAGLLFSIEMLTTLGIVLFSLAALFQLVTLPVEFNASRRAMTVLEGSGQFSPSELRGSKNMLTAAALTYVAALAVTLAQLLRLVLLAGNRNRR